MEGKNTSTGALTVSHLFGEMTWVMSQSPLHRGLAIAQLETLVMAPIMLRQLYVFRDGARPIGFATWAFCDADSEKKLQKGLLDPKAGFGADDWKSGDRCWLIDLVAPFATDVNKHRELMMADLVAGPLKEQAFKMHQTDPATGERKVVEVKSNAGEKLRTAILDAADETKKN